MTSRLEEAFQLILGREPERPAGGAPAEGRPPGPAGRPRQAPAPPPPEGRGDAPPEAGPRARAGPAAQGTPGGEESLVLEREDGPRPPRPQGGYFYPAFLSDQLMRHLSLGEQSLFHRFYRLVRGLGRESERVTLRSLSEACGVSHTFAASIIASLQKKGLLRVVRRNPITRSAVYRLQLPAEVRERILLCGVCHGLIEEGEAWRSYPLSRGKDGTFQTIPCHRRCAGGDPLA